VFAEFENSTTTLAKSGTSGLFPSIEIIEKATFKRSDVEFLLRSIDFPLICTKLLNPLMLNEESVFLKIWEESDLSIITLFKNLGLSYFSSLP
jgi:hypothetical protein